ncbi:MAG: hypothetical protein IT221_02970 [Fluviicola sp.]|nr:hypothetical protein [Fluviicola sp.]
MRFKLKLIRFIDTIAFLIAYVMIAVFNTHITFTFTTATLASILFKIYLYQSLNQQFNSNDIQLFGVQTKRNKTDRFIKLLSGIPVIIASIFFITKNNNELFWWVMCGFTLSTFVETLFRLSRWTVIIEGKQLHKNTPFSKPFELNQNIKIRIITNSKIEICREDTTIELMFDVEELAKLENVIAKIDNPF